MLAVAGGWNGSLETGLPGETFFFFFPSSTCFGVEGFEPYFSTIDRVSLYFVAALSFSIVVSFSLFKLSR